MAISAETPALAPEWYGSPPPPRTGEPDGSGGRSGQDAAGSPRVSALARIRANGLDLRNTWQVLAGAILLPLGVAVIILGWNGAAHGRVDQQQIPYLISGGILGLACVMVGCFFFWAHWLYRIYDQADLHHQEAMREQSDLLRTLIDAVERRPADPVASQVAAELAALLEPVVDADPANPPVTNGRAARSRSRGATRTSVTRPVVTRHSGGARQANGTAPRYVVTPTGTNFHTPACPMVANRLSSLRQVSAEDAAGLRPCRICDPLER